MATKKKAVSKAAKPADEIEDATIISEPEVVDDLVDDEIPDEIAIRNVFLSLGEDASGVVVSVYRIDDKKQKEYLYECQPEDFSLDNIRDDWGGGKYRIYARNAAGHFVLNRVVRIAQPRKVKQPESPGIDLMSVISKLGEQQAQAATEMRTMILELMIKNQPATQSFNPADMMTSMVTTMTAVQKMMGGSGKTDPVDMLLKGLDLADKFGGSGDRDTGMFDVLKEIIKQTGGPLAKAAEAAIDKQSVQPTRQRHAMPPPGSRGQSRPATPPASNPSIQTTAEKAMELLNKNLGLILAQAKRNGSTDLWGDLVIDQIPDDQWDQFCDLIFMPDVIDRMAGVNPEIEQYRPWFEALVARMRWNLSDQDDASGLTEGGDGGIDVNSNHSQQGKDATTAGQGPTDGAVSGEGGNGPDD